MRNLLLAKRISYKEVRTVIYVILLIMMMVILSFAFKLIPGGENTSVMLMIAASAIAAVYTVASITYRRGMMSDLTAVGVGYIAAAAGAIAFCLAAAGAASFWMARKKI